MGIVLLRIVYIPNGITDGGLAANPPSRFVCWAWEETVKAMYIAIVVINARTTPTRLDHHCDSTGFGISMMVREDINT